MKVIASVLLIILFINSLSNGEKTSLISSNSRISKPHVSKRWKATPRKVKKHIPPGSFDTMYLNYTFEEDKRCRYKWINVSKPHVPLVKYGWNKIINETEVYFDERGYKYCNNGQNDKWSSIVANNVSLFQKYIPVNEECKYKPLEKDQVRISLKNKWIHMIGDSLTRDTYYDLLEYLEILSPCMRIKTHDILYHFYEFNDMRKSTIYFSFSFNSASRPQCCEDDFFLRDILGNNTNFPSFPNVIVWSSGLWFTLKYRETINDNLLKYRNRLVCLGNKSLKEPAAKFIFRMTTPYTQPKFLKRRSGRFIDQAPLHYAHNLEGLKVLWKEYNWNVLDSWTMLRKREDLTVDGGHYTGVGSRTITYQLLEVVTKNIPSKL